MSEFRRVGLHNDVHLLPRDRDTEDGMRGCFQAHVDAAAAALAEMRAGRARVAFIFEARHMPLCLKEADAPVRMT